MKIFKAAVTLERKLYLENSSSQKKSFELEFFKVIFSKERIGFTEYLRWEHLSYPKFTTSSPLFQNLMLRAYKDAYFYQSQVNSAHRPPIKNHDYLFEGRLISFGGETIKIKLGKTLEPLTSIPTNYRHLALDANFLYTTQEVLQVVAQEKILYLEDAKGPTHPLDAVDHPFNRYERGPHEIEAKTLIQRPACRIASPISCRKLQVIFSSNLASPLGEWHDYCDLIHFGDLNLEHGIALLPVWKQYESCLKKVNSGLIPDQEIIKNMYSNMEQLPWQELNLKS